MDLIPAPAGEGGNLSSGVNRTERARPDSDGKFGRLKAMNLETHKVLWVARQRAPIATCSLATAGGVVFAGYMDRHFQAFDAHSGTRLWAIRLNDMPSGCPISYSLHGKQYVAVVVSNGGLQTDTFAVSVPAIQNPPTHGAAVWVFGLPQAQ